MALQRKSSAFFASEEGKLAATTLQSMLSDSHYITTPGFSANTEMYENSEIPFIDKHMRCLSDQPSIKPHRYPSNLKLMTKRR